MAVVKLSFNAAEVRIGKGLQPRQLQDLSQLLSFEDKASQYMAQIQGWGEVQTRCLLNQERLTFPTGLLPRVVNFLNQQGIQHKLENRIPEVQPQPVELPEWLWEHQRRMIQAATHYRRGIIKSPTGSGKTKAAAYFIKQFPQARVLMTVPSKDLLSQTAKALGEVLQEPIGMVGDGKRDFQRVTVGIINSLVLCCQDPTTRWEIETSQILVMDEAHRTGSDQYVQLSQHCRNVDFKIGLSATPWRGSGDNWVMEGVVGPIILSIEEMELVDLNIITKPTCVILEVPDPKLVYGGARYRVPGDPDTVYYPTGNRKPDPQAVYYEALINNDFRNHLIIDVIETFLASSFPYPGLAIVEKVKQAEILQELLTARGIEVPHVYGKHSTAVRNKIYQRLNSGDLRFALVGGILNEGTDIPALGFAVLASGGSSSSKLLQQVGRFIRRKDRAVIVDFNDQEHFYLHQAAAKRQATLAATYPGCLHRTTLEGLKTILEGSSDTLITPNN